jgi:kynurenine formamidase
VTSIPTEQELLAYFDTLSNWHRWGADDQLGTLNYVTPAQRQRAAALVTEGVSVSCALPMLTSPPSPPQPGDNYGPINRFMLRSGEGLGDAHPVNPRPRWTGCSEYLSFVFHGQNITHLDALSHLFWDRQTFNGHPAEVVTSTHGATQLAVTAMQPGIFTRGVLIDLAAMRGVDWLPASEPVLPADLESAEKHFDLEVGRGDVLLLRTGYAKRKREVGHLSANELPGFHAACLPWFHERQVAMIGADMDNDVRPSGYECTLPVHYVAICAMGMPLIDNCDLEELSAACADRSRYEFCFSVAPLPISGATGSPVNPVAIF